MSRQNMPGFWTPSNGKETEGVVVAKRGPCPWVPPHQCDIPRTRAKLQEETPCYNPQLPMPCIPRTQFGDEAIAEAMKNI